MNWASGTPAVKSTPASLSPSTTSFAFSGFIFSPLLSKIPDYASHHPGYEIGARSAPYENLRDIRDFRSDYRYSLFARPRTYAIRPYIRISTLRLCVLARDIPIRLRLSL